MLVLREMSIFPIVTSIQPHPYLLLVYPVVMLTGIHENEEDKASKLFLQDLDRVFFPVLTG